MIQVYAASSPLSSVLTDAVVARWRSLGARAPGEMAVRLETVAATTVPPPVGSTIPARWHYARRLAWEGCVAAASASGLLDVDLTKRLQSPDTAQFHGALAECYGCWYLTRSLSLSVKPRPSGRDNRRLDFLIDHSDADIKVEVKSIRSVQGQRGIVILDRTDELSATVDSANRQFKKGDCNLLVVVADSHPPLARWELMESFLAEAAWQLPFDPRRGQATGDVEQVFLLRGQLLRPDGRRGGKPRFTRVSGVLCLQYSFIDRGSLAGRDREFRFEPYAALIHNPSAANALPAIWTTVPQFLELDPGSWGWSDRKPLYS